MLSVILKRRSIRHYTSTEVSEQEINLLLQAAMAAPTAHNLQPWRFCVVRDAEIRAALAETHEFAGALREAPVVIVVGAEAAQAVHWLEDACVAAQNILLQATHLALGTDWVAIYPHRDHELYVRGVLDVPEDIRLVCMIPVGHAAEVKEARTQYDPSKVHFERFRNV